MKRVKKILKWTLIILIIGIGGLAVFVKVFLPNVGDAPDMKVSMDADKVARGEYLANHVCVCMDCHGTRDWTRFSGPPTDGAMGKGGELFDQAGGTGDATGTPTYDMFNQPLTNMLDGTVDPVTGLDACPISQVGIQHHQRVRQVVGRHHVAAVGRHHDVPRIDADPGLGDRAQVPQVVLRHPAVARDEEDIAAVRRELRPAVQGEARGHAAEPLERRVGLFVSLPFASIDRLSLKSKLVLPRKVAHSFSRL